MRAVTSPQGLGPLLNYRLERIAVPQPGPGQVRVRVTVAALGFADGLLAQGLYQVRPPQPFIPACEFAGIVDAVGDDVSTAWIGKRVAAQALGGGLAEFALAPADAVHETPDELDDAEAAAFWADYATAYHALRDRARLQPGETLLVLGAAGGVGLAAVQVGRILDANIIAAASSAQKRAAAASAGAQTTIDYTVADWTEQLKTLTNHRGIDVVFDPVGGPGFEKVFRRLAWGGRHLVIGFTGGPIPSLPANLPLLKGASLVGVDIRQFAAVFEREKAGREVRELAELVRRGRLRPRVGSRFSLDDFAAALAACQDRQRIGKTVVLIHDL